MYQKRSAWILTGVARNHGEETNLSDIELAVQTEIPLVKQHLSDCLWAIRGQGAHAERYNRLTEGRTPITLQPSREPTIAHGYAEVVRFFPGAREELAAIDEEITPTLAPGGRGLAGSRRDVATSATSKGKGRAPVVAQHDGGNAASGTKTGGAHAAAPIPVRSLQLASSAPAAATILSHGSTPVSAPESVPSASAYAAGSTLPRPAATSSSDPSAAPALPAAVATTIDVSQRVAAPSGTTTAASPRILPISTAGAAPIAARTTSGASALSAVPVPESTLWETAWPAAASFAAGGMMVLGALALRRRQLARAAPHWSSTAKATMPGIAPSTDLDTFANFAAVTELNFGASASSSQNLDRHETSMETASLDTLLGDVNEDAVEERALREAWAAAQTGIQNDPGSSGAILKAIADAERDLAVTDITFTLDELEVNLDDHIIPDNDSFIQPMRKTA